MLDVCPRRKRPVPRRRGFRRNQRLFEVANFSSLRAGRTSCGPDSPLSELRRGRGTLNSQLRRPLAELQSVLWDYSQPSYEPSEWRYLSDTEAGLATIRDEVH